jgi:putative transposase
MSALHRPTHCGSSSGGDATIIAHRHGRPWPGTQKRHTTEQIIGLLRQAEVELAQGRSVGEICRGLGVSEASYYRWRSEYGGLKVDQARRL